MANSIRGLSLNSLRDVLITSPADTEVLTYVGADQLWENEPGGGGGGTPGSPTTSIQFNNAGSFGGSADLTWTANGLTNLQYMALGSDAALHTNPLTFEEVLTIARSETDPGTVQLTGQTITTEFAPSADATFGPYVTGLNIDVALSNAFDMNTTEATGQQILVVNNNETLGTVYALDGQIIAVTNVGGGNISQYLEGSTISANHQGAGTVPSLYGQRMVITKSGGAGAITNAYGYWLSDPTGIATNGYAFWSDSPGVFRIKDDGVLAYYNPGFATKYTPGGTNYERVVLQWETNVATLTTEAGGTGTLRALNLGDTGTQIQVNGKNLTLSGNLTTTGSFNPTFAIASSSTWTFPSGGGTLLVSGNAAPTDATYITQTASAGLSAEQALASLSSGIMRVATTTGVITSLGDILPTANGGTGIAFFTAAGPTVARIYTFPDAAVTIASLTGTETFTNKRITKRVVTASDATSVTPNSDSADITYQLNTQAAGTLTINADGGTPTNGQSWVFKIKSTNAQTFAWNGIFVGGTVALPTVSTGGSKIDYFAFLYDSVTPKWDYTGSALGF